MSDPQPLDEATLAEITRRTEGVRAPAERALARRGMPTGRVRDISGTNDPNIDYEEVTPTGDFL